MKKLTLIVLLLSCATPVVATAHDCGNALTELLNLYSEQHGTKFVVDPRVRADVNMIGIDTDTIDAAVLMGILNLHGFTALTSDGVVYVMPENVAEASGDKYGKKWEG